MSKNYQYFEGFIQAADYACQSAELLCVSLQTFDPDRLEEMMISLHRIEHIADEAKHGMMNRLAKEFLPPLAREDIILLAQEIDDVTDAVEDVMLRIFMFHIQIIRPEALAFASLIQRCCVELREMFKELPHYRRSAAISSRIVAVNQLEEEADNLYCDSVRALYATKLDALETMSWNRTLEQMEKCCDLCEKVANSLEMILLKSS